MGGCASCCGAPFCPCCCCCCCCFCCAPGGGIWLGGRGSVCCACAGKLSNPAITTDETDPICRMMASPYRAKLISKLARNCDRRAELRLPTDARVAEKLR